MSSPTREILDHDDFGLNQPKVMNVIDFISVERDAGGKPVSTFPHPALDRLIIRADFRMFAQDRIDRTEHFAHARLRDGAFHDNDEFGLIGGGAH